MKRLLTARACAVVAAVMASLVTPFRSEERGSSSTLARHASEGRVDSRYANDDSESPSPKVPPPPLSGPRELLGLLGVDDRHFHMLKDGHPVGPDEREALLKFLQAVRRVSLADIDQWKHRDGALDDLMESPDDGRGEIVALSGRVTRLTVETPAAELAARFDMPQYYRCDFQIGDEALPATVYALRVPQAWRPGQPLDEPAGAAGFFLKLAGQPPHARPIFVAGRMAWHPATVLGNLGMDVGLLDDVRDKSAILAEERECFYQLLAAAGRASTADLQRRTNRTYSVVPLFPKPDEKEASNVRRNKWRGALVALTGTARRAVMVRVEDADIVARFGIDHYYELELFTEDSQGNPIVFCVRKLPQGFPEGETIVEPVRIAGFFLKTWTYRLPPRDPPERANQHIITRQIAPLLIGREPIWIQPQASESAIPAAMAGGLVVAGLLALCLIVWRLNRGDERFRRQAIARKYAPAEGESLRDLRLEDAP